MGIETRAHLADMGGNSSGSDFEDHWEAHSCCVGTMGRGIDSAERIAAGHSNPAHFHRTVIGQWESLDMKSWALHAQKTENRTGYTAPCLDNQAAIGKSLHGNHPWLPYLPRYC